MAITALFLGVTVAAAFVTREWYRDARAWVAHTADVRLALAKAGEDVTRLELAIARDEVADTAALQRDATEIRALTADNPRQIARVAAMRAAIDARSPGGARRALVAMMDDEDGLMRLRDARERSRGDESELALETSGALTLALIVLTILQLRHSARSIAERAARDARRLESMSITDELTGLRNRRGFVAIAEQRLREAARGGASFGILYADLNGLKQVNDAGGHAEGDAMIRAAASVLETTFGGGNVVARLGGDEFAVLVTNEPPEIDAIERMLRDALDAHNFSGSRHLLSMSTGYARASAHRGKTLDELLAVADRKMYEAKRSKRLFVQKTSSDAFRAAIGRG